MIMNYEYMSKEDLMLLVRQKEHENMVNKLYLYIKGFAMNGDMKNTLKALAIAKELHEGQYRKCKKTLNKGLFLLDKCVSL